MRNTLIIFIILLLPFLAGCNESKQSLGALPSTNASPLVKADPAKSADKAEPSAAKDAKPSKAVEKPFEYKEPDPAFFKVAYHKLEGLPRERTEELITLPGDMAVVRYVTEAEPELKNERIKKNLARSKEEGNEHIFYRMVLLNKKTKEEADIDVTFATLKGGEKIIIDAMINDELTECRWIEVNNRFASVHFCNINEPIAKIPNYVPLTPLNLVYFATIRFVTPSLIHVNMDVPEGVYNRKVKDLQADKKRFNDSIKGIEYYIKPERTDLSGAHLFGLDAETVWYSKKYYDYFHNRNRGEAIYSVAEGVKAAEYSEMPRPEYDLSEWKGWTRMNFDRKNLIK